MHSRAAFSRAGLTAAARALLFLLLLLTGALPAGAADTFTATGAMSTPRRGHTATRLPDARVLAAGGLNSGGTLAGAELYDPVTGLWTATGPLSTARSGHTAVLLQSGKVLISGGRDAGGAALASAEVYDPATGIWTATGAMQAARRHHTATLLKDGKVLVAGGAADDAGAVAFDTSELYNPSTGTWTDGGLFTQARAFHSATLVGDYVYILGGVSGGVYNTLVELYMPDRAEWNILGTGPGPSDRARKFHTATLLPNFEMLVAGGIKDAPLATSRVLVGFGLQTTGSLSSARSEHTATLLPDGRVLAAGGVNGAGAVMAGAESYSRTAGAWSAAASLKTARAGHTATLLPGGRVLITGGYDANGALASCELYTAKATQWTETAPMFTGRMGHNSILLPNGKVLVTGGTGWGQSIVGSAEFYDPVADAWKPTNSFTPRASHSSTLLADGRVMVTGGYTNAAGSGFSAATSIYDPATNSWSAASPLKMSRAAHAAVLLAGGKVLVAGGYRSTDYAPLDSVELFDPVTGAWTAAAPIAAASAWPAAVLLPNGKVLVVSGPSTWEERLGTAEIYDPAAGTWTATGPLNSIHAFPSLTLLESGKVLLTRGFQNDAPGTTEIYDPAANQWEAASPMLSDGFSKTPFLMQDGRVLFSGDDRHPGANQGRAEIYDPVNDSWSFLNAVKTFGHGTTLLTDGRIFFTGGHINGVDPATVRTQTLDPYFASAGAARPVIASASFDGAGRLILSGTGFTGGTPATAPVVKLRRLDNGQTLSLLPDSASAPASDTTFTSLPLTGFPQGHAMVTVFVNGIPGVSAIVSVPAPEISVERTGTGAALADGGAVTFDSTAPGGTADITFTVKNTGSMALTGLAVSIDGANAGDFTVTAAPAASVPGPSGSTNFTVRFAPVSPGVKSAVLQLASSDTDESPFDLTLTGAGSDSAPVIAAITGQAVNEDGATGAIAFTVGDGETPGALTLSASSSNPSLIAASGIVFGGTGANRTVNLTPLPNQNGTAVITLTVSDGVFQASASFTLTVSPVDDPPAFDAIAGPVTVLEDSGARTVALTGISAGPGESGQPLTVSAVSGNPALVPNPAVNHSSPGAAGTLSFTPVANASGTAVITVSLSDGPAAGHTVTRSFTVTVTPVNDAPALAAISSPAAIPEDAGMQTAALAGISAGPGENQPLSVTAVSSNPALIAGLQVSYSSPGTAGTLSYTPQANASGTAVITVTVSDGQSANSTAAQSFTVTVSPVNDPPVLAAIAAPAPVRENAGVQTIALSGISAGPGDDQTLTVSAVSGNPALTENLSVNYSSPGSGGVLNFTPAPGMSGTAVITVTVDDGTGGANSTAGQSFTVKVLPLIRGEPASVNEGNDGASRLSFRLFTGMPQAQAVSVDYRTEAGGAQAGSDFSTASGTAVIAAGTTETFVNISVTGDTEFEADETLSLILSNPSGAFLQTAAFTGIIVNDDAQPALSVTPGSVTESSSADGPFRVWVSATLSAPASVPLTWTVATRAGTAQAGSDFTPLGPVALAFAPGETSKRVAVAIAGGAAGQAEGDEEFYLDFTAAAGPAGTVTAVCTVRRLAITDFLPRADGIYIIRFPTGTGQSYVIEAAESPAGPWTNSSSLLFGSGSTVTQVLFSEAARCFFRVSAAPAAPGAADAGP